VGYELTNRRLTSRIFARYLVEFRVLLTLTLWAGAAFGADLDLAKNLPDENGWRAARWGMTLSEVAGAFGNDFISEKRSKEDKEAVSATLGQLRTKIPLDGYDYEVKFGFDRSDRLNSVDLHCGRAPKEALDAVQNMLAQRFGKPRRIFRLGVSRIFVRTTFWLWGNRVVAFGDGSPGIFRTTSYNFHVSISTGDTERDQEPGLNFAGDIWLRQAGKGDQPGCIMAINPDGPSVKATCGGSKNPKVVLDRTLTPRDSVFLESPYKSIVELNFLCFKLEDRGCVFFQVPDDIVATMEEWLPDRIQRISLPSGAPIDPKTLKDIDSKHTTRPDRSDPKMPTPVPGKAVLVAIRPLSGWSLQEKIHVDDRVVLVNDEGTHSFTEVEPGEHLIAAQGFKSAAALRMDLESGKVYYFLHGPAGNTLSQSLVQLSDDLGQVWVSWTVPSRMERKQ
jgi:hypothetical protein